MLVQPPLGPRRSNHTASVTMTSYTEACSGAGKLPPADSPCQLATALPQFWFGPANPRCLQDGPIQNPGKPGHPIFGCCRERDGRGSSDHPKGPQTSVDWLTNLRYLATNLHEVIILRSSFSCFSSWSRPTSFAQVQGQRRHMQISPWAHFGFLVSIDVASPSSPPCSRDFTLGAVSRSRRCFCGSSLFATTWPGGKLGALGQMRRRTYKIYVLPLLVCPLHLLRLRSSPLVACTKLPAIQVAEGIEDATKLRFSAFRNPCARMS